MLQGKNFVTFCTESALFELIPSAERCLKSLEQGHYCTGVFGLCGTLAAVSKLLRPLGTLINDLMKVPN
jgi:hypothetical protein